MRKLLVALLLVLSDLTTAHLAYASAVVPIDTLPKDGNRTGFHGIGVLYQWFDLAVGFSVPTFGTITNITTSIYPYLLGSPFYVGIASNEIIGNPAEPNYFSPPPGSLAEFRVCPNLPIYGSGCAIGGHTNPQAGLDGPLEFALDLFLPKAGTYWIYARFYEETVLAGWLSNHSIQTDLIATRTGVCTGDIVSCDHPGHRTFFLVDSPGPAPGLRVEYEPGLRIPEPSMLVLLGIGIAGFAASRWKRRLGA